MAFAEMFVAGLSAYFGTGAIVAILFLLFGASRIDHAADGASLFFRPMIFLGCVALWPFIILRVLSMRKINKPIEGEE